MKFGFPLLILSGLLYSCATVPTEPVAEGDKAEVSTGMTPFLQQTMPVDREVRVGHLANGLRYYVRHNQKPEQRLELRLVVKAGSVLEEEQQQGLAHFVEHMAFNGTEQFARQEIVGYLESIGMAFGPEINAYTGFDETAYKLRVPTDNPEVLETAFRILENWAHRISFEGEEIDKERGVVIEEWRLGRGAGARIRDRHLPVLLRGSRYAERLPIGQRAVLDSFHHEALRRFYRDWYRPDLMAVIAVGDCDPQWVEERLKEVFSGLPPAAEPRERPLFPVPDHGETLFIVAADPEATRTSIAVYQKMEVREQQTTGAYRHHLVEALYQRMLNQRLYELTMLADPPFLYGHSGQGLLVQTKEGRSLSCGVPEDGIERGLEALLTESRRAFLHGFTQQELEREKKEMLRSIEQAYRERDKAESERFAEEYKRSFLEEEPIPGLEYEYGLYQTFIPEIGLAEVNGIAREWTGQRNRVITVSLPEKEGLQPPTEEGLREIFVRVAGSEPEPYREEHLGDRLMEEIPPLAEIQSGRELADLGLTEWVLENGVRVVLKPTDFKNDEILFSAFSLGGHSLAADDDYIAALTADLMVKEGGVAGFSKVDLEKMLAGQVVKVAPRIESLQEGFQGGASPEDVETMFQLIYLYATAPRKDSTAFASYLKWFEGMIENRSASPEAAFSDTIQVTVGQHHFRARPWSRALIEEMDLEKSMRIYRERFGDAGDFTFFFVGNFSLEQMRPLVQRYLGNLPTTGRRESWRDIGMEPPHGVVEKRVFRGVEEKSLSRLIFTGPFEWSYENFYQIHAMVGVLRIKLREVLREDLGGTYGARVDVSTNHFPRGRYRISVTFGCDPERVDELTGTVFAQIDSLAQVGPDSSYVQKVQEMHRRQHEVRSKENDFWLDALEMLYFHNLDPRAFLGYEGMVDRLDSEVVRREADRYFKRENYIRVVLFPEKYKDLKNK